MTHTWQKTGLLGRDMLLTRKIYPRIREHQRFLLKGNAGVGKSALLEWCAANTQGKVAIVRARKAFTEILTDICDQWDIEPESNKAMDKERAILQETGNTIYIDDLHKANPKLIMFLKIITERHVICGTLTTGIKMKEDIKQVLWGMESITIPKLDQKEATRLSEKVCLLLGSRASFNDVALASRGLPGRIISFATAGEVSRAEIHLQSEEIDISPIFLICGSFLVLFRYIGRAADATDLTMIGGASMIILILMRMIMSKGKEK